MEKENEEKNKIISLHKAIFLKKNRGSVSVFIAQSLT